jgi:hypothetical protein
MVILEGAQLTVDLLSEVLEIIDSCTFPTRSISSTMWRFFPILHKVFKEYAIDFIEGNPRILRS